jgi:hypothetical protein
MEAGSPITGGAAASIFCVGTDEASHYGRKNEEIPGAVHSTKTNHFTPG